MWIAAALCRSGLRLLTMAGLVVIAACGDSSPVQTAPPETAPPTAAQCQAGGAVTQKADSSLVPDTAQMQTWVQQIEQFGGGFRPAGSAAELGYIDQLAAQLRAMGASQVQKESYTFPQWTPQSAPVLTVMHKGTTEAVPVAAYVPYSGDTGAAGVDGQLTYLAGLSLVDLSGDLLGIEQAQNPVVALEQLLGELTGLVGSLAAGTVPLADYLLTHNLKGRVVIYDVPRLTIPVGVFEALSFYTNNSGGTLGPLTPYSRPFIDMILINSINSALKQAGAVAAIGVIDYPAAEADGSYYPFFGTENQTLPGVYVDSTTGAELEQMATVTPVQAHMTLAAPLTTGTSYNLSAVIPGLCPQQILISSHVDGTNAMEDDGPAAILAIARYFLSLPLEQRWRGLRIVLTSGHFVNSAGINHYIQAHQSDLNANVLAAMEVEHLGAKEWLELSPGTMGLDGLAEPQLLMAKPGTPLAQEAETFARQFDRSMAMPPALPVGEGQAWASTAGLPLLSFITGPVYLLNDDMPQASNELIDYALMQQQVTGFIQIIHDLNAQPVHSLRPDWAALP